MEILKKDLSEQYVAKDFDKRCVPKGGECSWLLVEMKYWVLEAKQTALSGRIWLSMG